MALEVEKNLGFKRELGVRRGRYQKEGALRRRVKEEERGNEFCEI